MDKSIDHKHRALHSQSDDCLTAARIHSLLEDSLSPEESAVVEEHLSTCALCRQNFEAEFGVPQWWSAATESLLEGSRSEFSNHEGDSHPADWNQLLGPTDDPSKLGRIGNYEVVGMIGRGGMGVVFKAFDNALNRYVAIKMLAPHLATSSAARKRFAREAQAAAAVVDDNVLPIYGVDQWQGVPYFVMQYSRGITLQKRIQDQGQLALNEILRIGMQTAKGLTAAHAQGLVHRDVKPSNILLDASVERVLLCDFGLARAVDDASLTRTGTIAGTPQYMSPEQVSGGTIDARSDLFSLGCVLYTLCTGRPPFRAESSYAILRQITDHEPRSIRQLNPEIPEWFEAIVAKLMAKSPNDRFSSAAEVSELLEKCLAHVQQPQTIPLPNIPGRCSSVAPRSFVSLLTTRWGIIVMSIAVSAALLAAMVVSQMVRPSLTVFGTKPPAVNGEVEGELKPPTTPELIMESQNLEGANEIGEGGKYSWKLKGQSVENLTIRVLHIENGKTRILNESIYQGGTHGDQRIEVELQLKDSREPMPIPGKMLIPTLAVSVNGLQANAETGEKFLFPGNFQGHSESTGGPVASDEVLGWFAYDLKDVDVSNSLESIVEASKQGATFLVTTADWKGLDQVAAKNASDEINDIQGTWQVTSVESEGELVMEDCVHEFQHIFAGNALTQVVGKEEKYAEFKLDPSASPKAIDIVRKRKTTLGIYELQGDDLRLCLTQAPQPRPTSFDSKDGRTITTFKRVIKKTADVKSNGYSLKDIIIRKTELNQEGQLEITFETLVESMWDCPGANGERVESGLELTFPRVLYNKKVDVDYPGAYQKESPRRTIVVDPKNKPVFIVSGDQREKIWEPKERDIPVDVRSLLEQGCASASMPDGLVIRIGACMGEADDDVPEDAKGLVELWEFTPHEVHRVESTFKEGKPVYHRLESRSIKFEDVCQDLLDGQALEIRERKGTGPEIVLAGTPYGRGSRSIEVEWNGKSVLSLHETNGPMLDAYPESDAIAFGKLYERLAERARAVLGPKAGEISMLH